ncbi:hypothetical protein [Nocardioides currus]|uniref:Uncharacterized protein n=1 Tax=Nocardioides currus TaxID=2133958 RepID=A0A2R7Z274_9ACTN|nr:hypothetical protein [Nocardioides currus]PUA82356.1 hypothetical protein C7S10_00960 [Nocardioides currus]
MTAILIPQARTSATPPRPGFAPQRLERLVRDAATASHLDLTGRCVVTEAATGAYVVTPVLAALAGARRVVAITRPTRYGTTSEVRDATLQLAERLGVAGVIEVVEELTPEHLADADVVTNSGHVRPIDERMAAQLRPGAVVPLMYESWELEARAGDVDIAALAARGVVFAGTNERHPHVDVFSYLGMMAVWQLAQAGVAVYRSRIALVCDNEFAPYVGLGLTRAGAHVVLRSHALDLPDTEDFDAIVIAQTPTEGDVLDAAIAHRIAGAWPGTPVMQFWGDLDRDALAAAGVGVWPPQAPPRGHMGVLPSDIGPEAIVRLQCGGLKVAEVLLKPGSERTLDDLEHIDPHPDCEVRDA